ncbi:MAG: ferric reductase-like transmembrane domain-containing protein [Streptosporangiaceae bacterium]
MRSAPARRYTGPRHHADWRAAALRRLWPAGLTSRAAAACMLAAVALAGLIVIAVSVFVVATGQAGGPLAQTLEACSGELALLALTVSVVLGVAATERHFLPPGTRVTAQVAHRAVALTAFGFLVVHILLETVGGQATPLAAVLPFVSASDRLYLGLGTIASDLVIAVIATSLARMRYSRSAHPQLWRVVHLSIYVAWPMAILHGILMPGVPVWAAWTYGICATAVALACTARVRMQGPLPQVPTEAQREPPPALPPGVAGLGNARPAGAQAGYRRPVTAGPQALSPPPYRPPMYAAPKYAAPTYAAPANRPAAQHQPGSPGQPAPGNRPVHPYRSAHRNQPAHPYRSAHRNQPAHPNQAPHRDQPAHRDQPPHPNQPPHPSRLPHPLQAAPREQPAHRARPARRPRIVARRPAHYRPEHLEPPEYPGPRRSRSGREPRPAPRPVPGPAPPWAPARHPTDLY